MLNSDLIKYILVDIHGVLTDGQERKRFLEYMSATYGMDYDRHNSLWTDHISALDIDQESASDYLSVVNSTFHTHISVNEYYHLVVKHITVNQVLLDALEKFSQHHQICIVSDNLKELRVALNSIFKLPFSRYLQFFSYELGKTKANGMFSPVLHQLRANPNECLFIDDSAKNIETAKAIGIKSVQFTTNEQLFTDLKLIA